MRRILVILPSIQIGGMETHCVDLTAELVRRGLVVGAIIPGSLSLDSLAERFLASGASVRRLDIDARNGRRAQVRDWPRLVRAISQWRPDVVHVQTGGPSGGLSLVAAARFATRAPVIVTEHDVPTEALPRRQRLFRSWMDRWSHALVAVSRRNAALRVMHLGAPAERFAVVLNGVPIRECVRDVRNRHRNAIRSSYSIGSKAVVIGSVVRLVEGKGLEDLVRAFAVVSRESTSELLLVGDGPLHGVLEELCRTLGIEERVHMVGHQADPTPFFDAMDLFVLAVPAGSMSIALLEAMSRRLTAVITFWGPEEAVIPGETGLAAPPNDPEGLARVLLRAACDAELRGRLAEAGAAHVRCNFSVHRVADDLLDVYRSAGTGRVPERLRYTAPPPPRSEAPRTVGV
jgi:glycosyltransferase involved in cell wall biosynthesis